VIQIIVALYAGLAARAGCSVPPTAVPAGVGLGVIASLTSTPILLISYSAATTTGGIASPPPSAGRSGCPPLGGALRSSCDFGDKAVTFALVTSVLARAAAAHAARFPLRCARSRRVRTPASVHPPHPAAALPDARWLLPAPAGALGTAAVAFGLAAAAGVRRVLVQRSSPRRRSGSFLFVLHDLPTTLAIGLRITTMVAGFRLARACSRRTGSSSDGRRGWSVTVAYVSRPTLRRFPSSVRAPDGSSRPNAARAVPARQAWRKRLARYARLALALLLSALHEVDERALALETRGLPVGGGAVRPSPRPPDPALERAARWALLLVCIARSSGRLV